MNNKGPRTDPCGTPARIGKKLEVSPLTTTACDRPVR